MKYQVNAFFGWIRTSEIASTEEMDEFFEELESFRQLRLKWDDQEWFPKREVSRNDSLVLATANQ
jgi:hypothetical protein